MNKIEFKGIGTPSTGHLPYLLFTIFQLPSKGSGETRKIWSTRMKIYGVSNIRERLVFQNNDFLLKQNFLVFCVSSLLQQLDGSHVGEILWKHYHVFKKGLQHKRVLRIKDFSMWT